MYHLVLVKVGAFRRLGFEDPNEGDIRINGESVVGRPPYRRNVNTVFQQYALFPHMTVAENVAFGLRRTGTPRADIRDRVVEALDMVRMRQFGDRSPRALSGGQQQRIALARALVNRPAVLLLDEPPSALDRQLREEMQVELKLLQSRLGTTFVFVTHDQGEALSMSDRIAVMNAGRIEQLGDATEIYGSPASAYVASFIGQQNFFDGPLEADGSVRVGVITATPADTSSVKTGQQVRAAVRPESVQVRAGAAEGAPNSAPGRVVGVSHLGDTMQFLVDVDGYNMLIKMPRPSAPRLSVGDSVTCSWSADDVHVYPALSDAEAAATAVDAEAATAGAATT